MLERDQIRLEVGLLAGDVEPQQRVVEERAGLVGLGGGVG